MKTWQWIVIGVSAAVVGTYAYKLLGKKSSLFVLNNNNQNNPNSAANVLNWIKQRSWFTDGGTGVTNWNDPIPDVMNVTISQTLPGKLELPNWIGEVNGNSIKWMYKSNPTIVHVWSTK